MLIRGLTYVILILSYLFLLSVGSVELAFIVHGFSRLLYISFVTLALYKSQKFNFISFKDKAKIILNNDAFTFVILCLVSKETFRSDYRISLRIFGVILIIFGGVIKIWAAKLLKDGYFWRDFFFKNSSVKLCKTGPYKFFENPMYTVGYLPAYGLALCFFSTPGLLAAFFDQTLILIFNYKFEAPHFKGLI